MKISIITVCRNAEQRIETAIRSVISQTYKDIEYIVIDGDSQDRTKAIIAQHLNSIGKFISEPDQGVYEAMNKGLRLASGQFVFFLNSDDAFVDEHVIQDVVNFLTEHPECDFLYGNLLFCVEHGQEVTQQLITFPSPEKIPEHLICDCLLHQASFAKADLFSTLGDFDENYKIGSDYAWFLKLIEAKDVKLCYYPRTIAAYHAGGMSSQMTETLAEMFEIQNKAAIYQSEPWLRLRIHKYQEVIKNPQGRFGLHRIDTAASESHSPQAETPQLQDLNSRIAHLEDQTQQLRTRLKKVRAREEKWKLQARETEAIVTAMSTSKFWKLRTAWLRLKDSLGFESEEMTIQPLGSPPANHSIATHSAESQPVSAASQPLEAETPDLFQTYYTQIRDPKAKGAVPCTSEQADRIAQRLRRLGIAVEDYTIDVQEYRQYFAAARYQQDFPNYYSFNLPEKSLEHYIATKLLKITGQDIYIDIASEGSPVPDIYSALFDTHSYRQDLAYPAGLNGNLIGGDAANMPVSDGFATKMALHCSLEHFEGQSDIGFIREVNRVLQPGGAVCILPLYLAENYSIQTDPIVSVPEGVIFEPDAIVHCAPGWGNRHGRFYDPEHLASRLHQNLNGLTMKLYRIQNAKQVDSSCYVQFAALIEKPAV